LAWREDNTTTFKYLVISRIWIGEDVRAQVFGPIRRVEMGITAFKDLKCGGGIKGGVTCGESDHWGYKPLDRDHPTTVHDVHATVMKLLGIDHTKLTWRNNGIDRRLTDVHGHVIGGILS